MTEKRVRCDKCGASMALEIRYDHERVRDAAGGTDTEYKTVDLCVTHLQERLQELLREPPLSPASCGKVAFNRWVQEFCTWKPKGDA